MSKPSINQKNEAYYDTIIVKLNHKEEKSSRKRSGRQKREEQMRDDTYKKDIYEEGFVKDSLNVAKKKRYREHLTRREKRKDHIKAKPEDTIRASRDIYLR